MHSDIWSRKWSIERSSQNHSWTSSTRTTDRTSPSSGTNGFRFFRVSARRSSDEWVGRGWWIGSDGAHGVWWIWDSLLSVCMALFVVFYLLWLFYDEFNCRSWYLNPRNIIMFYFYRIILLLIFGYSVYLAIWGCNNRRGTRSFDSTTTSMAEYHVTNILCYWLVGVVCDCLCRITVCVQCIHYEWSDCILIIYYCVSYKNSWQRTIHLRIKAFYVYVFFNGRFLYFITKLVHDRPRGLPWLQTGFVHHLNIARIGWQ